MTTADDTPRYGPALANPRIAFVVFNAMTHDTRVIREAQAAMAAGATVRVFAYGGKHIGLVPAGIDQVDGVEVERVRISSLAAIVFALLALRKRLRRSSASAAAGTAQAPSKPGTTAVVASPLLPASVLNGPLGAVLRQGLRMDVTLRQISFWLRATRAVRAWGPDLVHAHDANTLMVVGVAARKLKVPFVYDSHELWTKRNVSGARPVARRLEGPMERFWIRRAGAVMTVSPSIAEWLRDEYGLERTPALVRNIPPFSGVMPRREEGRLRELAGLSADTSVVAYCGSITTNRGIERGVAALPFLPSSVHLVLMGPGSAAQLAEVSRLAGELGVSDRVHVVGAVPSDQVSAALADADVSLVLTRPVVLSYAFSLPNKLFESMHAGIPVLVSDTPDASALVREWGLGEVVASEGPAEDVAAMIMRVIEGGAGYRAAAVEASGHLNWQTEVVSLIGVHNAALASRGGGRR